MMLWIELGFVFKAAHRNDEDSLIRLIYEYALWCVAEAPRGSDAGHDPATAAVVAFFEHLPEDLQARRRIHEFMSFDQMDAVKESFRYHLDNDQFGELMDELRDQYKKSRKSRI